jgi:nucleotide-binding universal stress UspA family protein
VSRGESGLAAAETAAALSALLAAPLVLLHAVRPVTEHPFRSQETFERRAAARADGGRELVEEICARCGLGGLAAVEVVAGDPADRLALMARRRGARMIVVGAGRKHGRPRSPRVARRLSEIAGCPVLVVPPGPVPTDARTHED